MISAQEELREASTGTLLRGVGEGFVRDKGLAAGTYYQFERHVSNKSLSIMRRRASGGVSETVLVPVHVSMFIFV
jgi:hypothetical protein